MSPNDCGGAGATTPNAAAHTAPPASQQVSGPGQGSAPHLTPAQFDAAFASLVVTMPDGAADAEIGPVTDVASHCMAEVIAGLIESNPELIEYVSGKLNAAPRVNGVRIVPVSALHWALQVTAQHRPLQVTAQHRPDSWRPSP